MVSRLRLGQRHVRILTMPVDILIDGGLVAGIHLLEL